MVETVRRRGLEPDIAGCLQETVRAENIDVQENLDNLLHKGLIALGEDGKIAGVYPVSALPTKHEIKLKDGRSFYAMCAIDSLGTTYEFDQDLTVFSSCRYCGEKIVIEAINGDISAVTPTTTHAIHVDIENYKNWAASC